MCAVRCKTIQYVLIPERCLPFMEMLAGVLETQNKYEEGISVCQEAIRQARILGYKKRRGSDTFYHGAYLYRYEKQYKSTRMF